VTIGVGWEFAEGESIDLDTGVIALDEKMEEIETVYFYNKTGCRRAIKYGGDNLSGSKEGGDAEVITLNLGKMPSKVFRLACVVNCYSKKHLSVAKKGYIRLFMGGEVLLSQILTDICDSMGLLFCFFQRNAEGAWFFRSVISPLSFPTAAESVPEVQKILADFPLF